MSSKINYTDEPLGDIEIVADFLPPPERLILKDESVSVTISLNKSSIDFYKKEAKRFHTSYENMIRRLLDFYASQFAK